jgi:predicted aspartyl protease
MASTFQWLCAASLALAPQASFARGDNSAPTDIQTFALTLLHNEKGATWTDIHVSRGSPFLQVRVNGQTVCGLIDTGSDRSLVDIGFAKAQGLTVISSDQVARATMGTIPTARVLDVPVEVPGQFRFQADLVGIDIPDYVCATGQKLAFVLGMEVLKTLAVGIDAPRRKVIFVRSGNLTPRSDNWARFDWTDGVITGRINGKSARLLVDTGSGTLLLVPANRFETFFAGMALEALNSSTDAVGRQDDNIGIRQVTVSLGNLSATSEAKRVAADERQHDAKLGFPFFISTFAIFDAQQNLISMRVPDRKP